MKQPPKQDREPERLKPVEELSYEEALAELEEIVNVLESNQQSLGEAMAYYQRGQELARYCAAQLDQAELKVQIISGDELVDFEQS